MAEHHRKKVTTETLTGIFKVSKQNIANSNLTIKEVAINSGVSEELVAIFFDNSNNIVNDLSRLIEFSKVELLYKQSNFTTYRTKNIYRQKILIKRIIKPFCTVNYNTATNKLSNFTSKEKLNSIDKQLLINEFYEHAMSLKKTVPLGKKDDE